MNERRRTPLPSLPCHPCPYRASCCAYGTSLTEQEAAALSARAGPETVYRTRWGEWRTRVRKKRCVFFRDGGCTVHDEPCYPAQCRGFPWVDAATGGRYPYDVTICGAFASRPELVALQRRIPSAARAGAEPHEVRTRPP